MTHVTGSKQHLHNMPEYSDFDPDLDIDVPEGYVVVTKDLPQPTSHPTKSGTIKWFNAFGVKDQQGADAKVTYTVTMQKLPEGKELFYLSKDGPQQISANSMSDAGTNEKGKKKIRFTLSLGDPPTGTYP